MTHQSNWDLNKETLIEKALADYRNKDCPSAGFNILRYMTRDVLHVKPKFYDLSVEMSAELGFKESARGFVYLRLAKLGALEWNGS